MKTIKCDFCDRQWDERDQYINGSLDLQFNEYLGDDGSLSHHDSFDICETCLLRIRKFLDNLRKQNQGNKK